MLNQRSITACDASTFGRFRKPLYSSYCFSRIPATLQKLLLGSADGALPDDVHFANTYDNVLLIFLDSFGWRQFEKYKDESPFIKRFVDNGIISKLTSQFPSTTTPHVTTMHTGLPVSLSGLYEWFYYEPIVDASICPLYFSYTKDQGHDSLLRAGYTAKELFPFSSLYQQFAKSGIRSHVFQDKTTAHSPYSQVMLDGAEVIGYKNLADGLEKLGDSLKQASGKNYFFFYFGDIDGCGHHSGPYSPECQKEIRSCLAALETFWTEQLATQKKSCCILTADHGMTEITPQNSWFLNLKLPHFEKYMKRNDAGELIVPCGSSRDFFLYIKEEHLETAYKELTKELDGIAEVKKISELIANGIFGPEPIGSRLLERLGNLVLLPYGTNSTWWYEPGRYENPFHGHHGGLSSDEMETIFLFQDIN